MISTKSIRIPGILACSLSLFACGSSNDLQTTSGSSACDTAMAISKYSTLNIVNGSSLAALSGTNVIPLTVNGGTCNNTYFNKPCIQVQVCETDGSNCQTISDILVDTGSYGLRVFKSVLSTTLQNYFTPTSGSNLAECVQFADGTADWGPVMTAGVILGGEPTVNTPIHVLDSSFGTVPSACGSPNTSPADAGFNGILGVGLFPNDCGDGCQFEADNGKYFTCSGTNFKSCAPSTASDSQQVQNPVSLLTTDNNGVVFELPSVPTIPDGAASSASGYLVLGIGSRANNTPPASVTTFFSDGDGFFQTSCGGSSFPSFIDSGSNANYIPDSGLRDCSTVDPNFTPGYYCPESQTSLLGSMLSSTGSTGANIPFQVGNFLSAPSSALVFIDAAGNGDFSGSVIFDWGLPFHLGRNVYVGIQNTASPVGTGPYWAF